MKIRILLLFLLGTYMVDAQNDHFLKVPDQLVAELNREVIIAEIDSASQASFMDLYARYFETNLTPSNAFQSGVDYIWKLKAEGFNIKAHFVATIHKNDTLLIKDLQGNVRESLHRGNTSVQRNSSLLYPEKVILQYRNHSGLNPELVIEGYSVQPRSEKKTTHNFGDSDFCEVNMNCAEGNNYREVQKAVVRIGTKVGTFLGWCTGTLVNNTAFDFKPYILTAEHCALNSSNQFVSESDFDFWEFYFYYTGDGCANPASESEVNFTRINGADYLARSHDGGGETGSDFLLLELTDTLKFNLLLNPYFAGWNRANSAPDNGVTIHHPEGDIKKVSTYNSNPVSSSFGSVTPDTHWEVVWWQTTNGHGVTEPGSSGSPLIDNQGLVRGTLTGGAATCFANTSPDYYGKFSYSWEDNGVPPDFRLRPWLDPENNFSFFIPGAYRGDSIPNGDSGQNLTLFPNPVTVGELFVEMDANQIIDVHIFNLSGKLVFSKEGIAASENQLNISRLKSGFYIARIEWNEERKSQKFLVINQ